LSVDFYSDWPQLPAATVKITGDFILGAAATNANIGPSPAAAVLLWVGSPGGREPAEPKKIGLRFKVSLEKESYIKFPVSIPFSVPRISAAAAW
jgi:hypothetical protein